MIHRIGVFDSGVGGLSVANAIKKGLPEHEVIFKNDAEHVPYGTKTMDEVLAYTLPVLQSLVEEGVECIVIACNTVSTNLIEELRKLIAVPLIAMEPMVKPAAHQTKTEVIAICATPATLTSPRYAWLKKTYASDITVLEPDCSDWAAMIEHDEIDEQKLRARIEEVLAQKADVIVLGCTHYHWIEEDIKAVAADRAAVIQPEPAIVSRVQEILNI